MTVWNICLPWAYIKTYTPYVEPQSLTLQTPNGLPGVPVSKDGNYTDSNGQQWVCDEIDLARGKYVQRVLLLKFDSNSPFDLQSINTNNIANFAYGLSKKSRSGSEGICNRLKQSAKLIANETNEGVHISESVIFIRLKTTRASTVEELKQFLANNPTDVLYQIATPIERDPTPKNSPPTPLSTPTIRPPLSQTMPKRIWKRPMWPILENTSRTWKSA